MSTNPTRRRSKNSDSSRMQHSRSSSRERGVQGAGGSGLETGVMVDRNVDEVPPTRFTSSRRGKTYILLPRAEIFGRAKYSNGLKFADIFWRARSIINTLHVSRKSSREGESGTERLAPARESGNQGRNEPRALRSAMVRRERARVVVAGAFNRSIRAK